MTTDDLCRDYRTHLIGRGLAAGTIRNYVAQVARWSDWAIDAGHDPRALDVATVVREWSTTLRPSESSRQMAIAALMHLAELVGLDRGVAGGAIERPKRNRPRNWRGLSVSAEDALTAASRAAGGKGTAVLVGLWAALRRSEIAALRWEDVDLDAGVLMAYRTKVDDWHVVPVDPRLRERLEIRHEGQGWVFPGRHGGHVSAATVGRWVGEIAAAAGIGHVTPHQLRYTCATRLFDATGNLAACKELLGHQELATTQVYLRLGWRIVATAMQEMHAARLAATREVPAPWSSALTAA